MSNASLSIAQKEAPLSPSPNPLLTETEIEPSEKFILTMIAERARLHPDRIALVTDSSRLTYGDLESTTTRLANHLRSQSIGPDVVVGICLERSPEFVIAAMAILKCGGAYLPMDPSHPVERLRFMAHDAGAHLLLTQSKFAPQFASTGLGIIALDTAREVIEQQSSQTPSTRWPDDHLAYVIYTSGSTGQPKGVEITHRNLAHLVSWHVGAFHFDSSAHTTFLAGVGFDAAVWEIWPTLAAGGTLHLPDELTHLSPEKLRDWLVQHQITTSFVPTAIAEQLITLPWPDETALRFLLTGADALHRYPPSGLPFALVNNYGPTECTVVATSGIIPPEENRDRSPSIGHPINGVHVFILDDQLRPVPNDTAGEIYIGGAGVGRGYRNRPDLTAERFIANPFDHAGDRLYRTGDFGRRLSNGEIDFLGRTDDQIKIRGNRIEPGEVTAILNQQPSVQASVVMTTDDSMGEKKLVAYLVPTTNSTKDEQVLRKAIKQRLPDYMEPTAFVWIDSFPLTSNGKIDRTALALLGTSPNHSTVTTFVAARNPVEERLADIIAAVLKLPRVGVTDDFFYLGAHSLLGAQIVARVRVVFGVELKLLDVFDAPTVAELAIRIEQSLLKQVNAMSAAEVDAALAAFDSAAVTGPDS